MALTVLTFSAAENGPVGFPNTEHQSRTFNSVSRGCEASPRPPLCVFRLLENV